MQIIKCNQGDEIWTDTRLGLVTASEVDALVSPTWKIRTGIGVETYVCKKIAESFLCRPVESFTSFATEQGGLIEAEARAYFELSNDCEVEQVGLVVSDDRRCAASPDGIIKGEQRGIEIKSPQPINAVRYAIQGILPPDYELQVHFSMFVTGFPWWSFYSYNRTLPKLHIVVERDEAKCAIIAEALAGFYAKFDAEWDKLNRLADEPRENPFK